MEKNRIVYCILLVCVCMLTGCAGNQTEMSETIDVQDWIQVTEEPDTQDSIVVENEKWTLCVNEEIIELNDGMRIIDEKDIYLDLDVLKECQIVDGDLFPTYYVDENGLRCVGVEINVDPTSEKCNVTKHYGLLDNTLIQYDDSLNVAEFLDKESGMLPLDVLFEMIGWEYIIDNENKQIQVQAEFIESVFYEPLIPQVVSNHVWLTDGTYVEADDLWGEEYSRKFSATSPDCPIEVVGGERLVIDFSMSWIPEIAGILFLKENGEVVQFYNSNTAITFEDEEIVVPSDATKMHLTFYANKPYFLDKKVERMTLSQFVDDQDMYELDRLRAMEAGRQDSWKNVRILFDKGYVSFVLDDCRPDMDVIADIFAEYQLPLCVAAVWENIYAPGSLGTHTRMEICQQVVDNGGEILAHDAEVLTEEALLDYNVLEKHFVMDKYYFEQAGFDVNGIILAGGAGQVVGSEMSDLWSRSFYRYSDLYGKESSGEPYYHRRFWLGNCLDEYKQIIADAISNKKWVSFYFHDLNEVNEEQLREILDYVVTVSDDLGVVNYKTIYSNIYGVQ